MVLSRSTKWVMKHSVKVLLHYKRFTRKKNRPKTPCTSPRNRLKVPIQKWPKQNLQNRKILHRKHKWSLPILNNDKSWWITGVERSKCDQKILLTFIISNQARKRAKRIRQKWKSLNRLRTHGSNCDPILLWPSNISQCQESWNLKVPEDQTRKLKSRRSLSGNRSMRNLMTLKLSKLKLSNQLWSPKRHKIPKKITISLRSRDHPSLNSRLPQTSMLWTHL